MKKIFILLFILLFGCCFSFAAEYKQSDTMPFDEYLSSEKSQKEWKTLKLNNNGDVIFKEKVVLTNKGEPLNENTAFTTIELKVLFAAKGVKPRRWCNPRNTAKNGTMGCYIDNPDKNNRLNFFFRH